MCVRGVKEVWGGGCVNTDLPAVMGCDFGLGRVRGGAREGVGRAHVRGHHTKLLVRSIGTEELALLPLLLLGIAFL